MAARSLALHLGRRGFPRLQFLAILTLTGAGGFGASFLLLRLGLEAMPLRYPIAAAAAYLIFLALLYLWKEWQVRRIASLDEVLKEVQEKREGTSLPGCLDFFIPDLGVDAPGCAIIIAILAAIAVVAWLLYSAPALLAELVLDGLLVSGLGRRFLKAGWQGGGGGFLTTALRMTWIPALVAMVLLAAAGFVLLEIDPEARSIGDIFKR